MEESIKPFRSSKGAFLMTRNTRLALHKTILTAITLLLFSVASIARAAGGINSGGGTGFVTLDKKVHLLDTYEANQKGVKLNLEDPTLPVMVRVQKILTRLSNVMPVRARVYQGWAATFWDEVQQIPEGQTIENPTDLGEVIVPAGSTVVQLAFQRSSIEVLSQKVKRYAIAMSLYNRLSSDDQVALVMHELIYHDQLVFSLGSSEQTRYINETILSDQFNRHAYVALMANGVFGENEFGNRFDLDPNRYNVDPTYEANGAGHKISYFINNIVGCQLDTPTHLEGFSFADDNIEQLISWGAPYLQRHTSQDGEFSGDVAIEPKTCKPVPQVTLNSLLVFNHYEFR